MRNTTLLTGAVLVIAALAAAPSAARADGEGLHDVLAAEEPDLKKAEAALAADAGQLEARGPGGARPLHVAARRGLGPIVAMLLARGAEVDATDEAGRTPLHAAAAAEAVTTADVVVALLGAGASPGVKDADGCTPLHLAAKAGKIAVADIMIGRGANLEAPDARGRTALHFAATTEVAGRKWVTLHLITKKANRKAKDANGQTPAEAARATGHEETATLIEGGMAAAEQLLTAKQWIAFARKGNLAVLRIMHGIKPELLDATDSAGRSALHVSITANQMPTARQLIEWGIALDALTKGSRHGPLHLAAAFGRDELIDILLERKVPIERRDADGCTPLHLAAGTGMHRVVKRLLARGASVDVRATNGQSALHTAATVGEDDGVDRDLRRRKVEAATVLIEAGAAVDFEDEAGRTPLLLAVEGGFADMVATLVAHDANPRVRSKATGETAWDIARRLGDDRVIQALRGKGK